MPQITVATNSDIDDLAGLRHEWSGASRHSEDDFKSVFREWYQSESRRRTFWIARINKNCVGMVNLAIHDRMPKPESDSGAWGYLSNMYVQGPYRNKGVGSLLVEALLTYADANGLARVVLNPSERSVPLYNRHGFSPTGQLLVRNRPSPRA